ncbi:MAG TPA: hypothetical protein VF605_09880 [Allosphingosinicella sp.]|jgi:hypothetical protein
MSDNFQVSAAQPIFGLDGNVAAHGLARPHLSSRVFLALFFTVFAEQALSAKDTPRQFANDCVITCLDGVWSDNPVTGNAACSSGRVSRSLTCPGLATSSINGFAILPAGPKVDPGRLPAASEVRVGVLPGVSEVRVGVLPGMSEVRLGRLPDVSDVRPSRPSAQSAAGRGAAAKRRQ